MKKNLLIIIAFFGLNLNSYSQTVKLQELIKISTSNLSSIEDLLSKKGYVFSGERKNDTKDLSEYSWKKFDNPSLQVVVIRSSIPNSIFMGTGFFFEDIKTYNSLKNECISLGFKNRSSEVNNGSIKTIYENKTHVIKFTSKSKQPVGAYFGVTVDIKKYLN